MSQYLEEEMNKHICRLGILLSLSLFYLSGCVNSETTTTGTKHPDAKEALALDKDANIFQWDGLIYKTDIDWVNELELKKKEPIGEITDLFSAETAGSAKNGMANKIPIGTKIYSTNEEGILMVEYEGEYENFLALVEG